MHDARGRALAETTTPAVAGIDDDHAALLPSPGTTAVSVIAGGALGFATVNTLAARHVDPLFGVAVIVALFAIAVLGLKSLTDARTEPGRAVAVGLNALATGAALGGLTVLL